MLVPFQKYKTIFYKVPEEKRVNNHNLMFSSQSERLRHFNMANEEALKKKQEGNTAYTKQNFPTAIECYTKAIELDPTEITFYTNSQICLFAITFLQ